MSTLKIWNTPLSCDWSISLDTQDGLVWGKTPKWYDRDWENTIKKVYEFNEINSRGS